ncbi:MAG: molybdopterin molybdotransferase MoeA [Conexivisphaerales archaeon]
MRPDIAKYIKLTDYEKALSLAISSTPSPEYETIHTKEAVGRIAAETIRSRLDIPETDIAMMDGYALSTKDVAGLYEREHERKRRIRLKVPSAISSGNYAATYVTTGSQLPRNADAVVKVEDTRFLGDEIELMSPPPRFKNVLKSGEDIRKGTIIVRKGEILNAAKVSLLLFEGINQLKVNRRFRIAVISVGTELKKKSEADDSRAYNNYAYYVSYCLKEIGCEPHLMGIAGDETEELNAFLKDAVASHDLILTIGRSSVGLNDILLDFLKSMNAEIIFHGVKLLPARPTGLARLHGKLVWMLPAHAVSSAVALFSLVIPSIIYANLGPKIESSMTLKATLSETMENERYLPAAYLVKLKRKKGSFFATPLEWGSNLMSSLLTANSFTILSPKERLLRGDSVKVKLLSPMELLRIEGD